MQPDAAQSLDRFVQAQEAVYSNVLADLSVGKKRSHWMWFIFPQLRGLGRSETARHFGIESRHEAVAYSQHPLLGRRLLECTALVLATQGKSANDIFGVPDEQKFRSCMTLFAMVVSTEPLFAEALKRFFEGQPDGKTLALLAHPAYP